VGAKTIDVCPGMVPWDQDVNAGWKQLVKSYRELDEYAKEKDVYYVVEPAHKFETNLILTIEDCLRMIDELKSDRFGILLDTGHCNVNGEDFRKVLPLCKGYRLHIHIDDNNGDADAHMIPGKGKVDFEALAEGLDKIGYKGFLSGELGTAYIMDPTSACKDTLAFLKSRFG
jgi:sugar phosphate isomerase/epimerase